MTDTELLKYVTEFRKGILGRHASKAMCLAVCMPLSCLLTLEGVENTLVEGEVGEWNHYWLELPDGRILDPTADQFGGFLPVYLGPLPPEWEVVSRVG